MEISKAGKLLRIGEAANILGLKTQSLRQMEKAGLLRPVRDWANHRRFNEEHLLAVRAQLVRGELIAAKGGLNAKSL